MSTRHTKPVPAARPVSAVPPSATVHAVRVMLTGKGRKVAAPRKSLPGGSGDKLYTQAGTIGAGLTAVGTAPAFDRHRRLLDLVAECRGADRRWASIDQAGSLGDVRTLGSLVEKVCDGALALVVIGDHQRAASIPAKTGFESQDPLAYVEETLHCLKDGDTEERVLGLLIRKAAHRYRHALEEVGRARDASLSAEDDVTTTRASLRSFIQDCRKFITQSTPSGHKARAHLKAKRKAPVAAPAPTTPPAGTGAPPATPPNAAVPPTPPTPPTPPAVPPAPVTPPTPDPTAAANPAATPASAAAPAPEVKAEPPPVLQVAAAAASTLGPVLNALADALGALLTTRLQTSG